MTRADVGSSAARLTVVQVQGDGGQREETRDDERADDGRPRGCHAVVFWAPGLRTLRHGGRASGVLYGSGRAFVIDPPGLIRDGRRFRSRFGCPRHGGATTTVIVETGRGGGRTELAVKPVGTV